MVYELSSMQSKYLKFVDLHVSAAGTHPPPVLVGLMCVFSCCLGFRDLGCAGNVPFSCCAWEAVGSFIIVVLRELYSRKCLIQSRHVKVYLYDFAERAHQIRMKPCYFPNLTGVVSQQTGQYFEELHISFIIIHVPQHKVFRMLIKKWVPVHKSFNSFHMLIMHTHRANSDKPLENSMFLRFGSDFGRCTSSLS